MSDTFVLDLSRPPRGQSSDPAYSVVKSYLGRGGYISQFVNFVTYNHDQPRDIKKSDIILSGVARQILSKCGVRIWWVSIPKSVPLPAVFVVSHSSFELLFWDVISLLFCNVHIGRVLVSVVMAKYYPYKISVLTCLMFRCLSCS